MSVIPTEVVDIVRTAQRVVVLTGAGISAESGVPTFREAQTGIWQSYDPRDLATPQGFARNSRLVWEWYAWRRKLMERAMPNLAHFGLVDLEQHVPEFLLITQNIDGLHWSAGSRDMVELHGNIRRTKCFDEGTAVDSWEDTGTVPPHCPHCGGDLRPDVVWFGEGIPVHMLNQSVVAITSCDVFVSIGTSGVVAPAASFAVLAKRRGAKIIEINTRPSTATEVADWSLWGPAAEVVPQLIRELGIPAYALEAGGG
ncbi:MAG: NAD-dependent deacylase [Herpetosiphon sp.]